jgi:pyruvate/2-oxoglutarate dehydrogenase complex dihydrolipoamide dehydrogenase (E3) component
MDEHNRRLVANVRPGDWVHPVPEGRYNLVVVGAGTAGLVAAKGAAGLGAKVALVERHLLGGDCLNVGCVPSKALLRSADAVAAIAQADRFGVSARLEGIDFAEVMRRVRSVRAGISENDSAESCRQAGVDVYFGQAAFTRPDAIAVDGRELTFAKAVVATGARAAIPPIEGIEQAGYLTNETVFSLTQRPDRLVVIGGGPIGCELAQAFARLGSTVTILERNARILRREDADAADILASALEADGVRLITDADIQRVTADGGAKAVTFTRNGGQQRIAADAILVGAGRQPNVEGLALEAAGVDYDPRKGVTVDERLRTSNRRIYAAGDVCSRFKFTHYADASARLVLRNALFFGRSKASRLVVPWCTYTDPAIAHVGLYEHEARRRGLDVETFCHPLGEADRARTDGLTRGLVKVHIRRGKGTILGATIVARGAGDMINELTLAITAGKGLGDLAEVIHPYPTRAEIIKHVADAYQRSRLTPRMKSLLQRLMAWRR